MKKKKPYSNPKFHTLYSRHWGAGAVLQTVLRLNQLVRLFLKYIFKMRGEGGSKGEEFCKGKVVAHGEDIINRPGVAGDLLQTPLLLVH